jgi:hypothetical protein
MKPTHGDRREEETIEIENVLFAQLKVSQFQRLVAISPDEAMAMQEA